MPPAAALCLAYAVAVMQSIHITDLQAAINDAGSQPCGRRMGISAPATAHLAEVYARMIVEQRTHIAAHALPDAALQAWLRWYHTTPDTPCIAICSTSQGDSHCKGCGRTFAEVQQWLSLSPLRNVPSGGAFAKKAWPCVLRAMPSGPPR